MSRGHVAGPSRSDLDGGAQWWLSGVLVLCAMVAVDLTIGRQVNGVYGGAVVLTAINADVRRTARVAVLAVLASVASGGWHHNLGERDWALRLATCVLICLFALMAANANQRRRWRLVQTTALAQRVLNSLAIELTGARSVKDVADGFLGQAIGTLGATSAMMFQLDVDQVLRTISWHGRTGEIADHYQEFPLASDMAGAVAVRERRDVHYRSLAQIEDAFPDLVGYYTSGRSLHLLPLVRDDTTYGLLAISFPPDLFTAYEDSFLRSLADALTSAVRRGSELQDHDATTQRTVLLAEASMRLSRSLDTDTTLEEVMRLLVPAFADGCSVQLLRDGRLETARAQHLDRDTTVWARSLAEAFPDAADAPGGSARVVRTGRSEIYPFISTELITSAASDADHLEILEKLALTSVIIVPLTGREGVVGTLTLVHAESRRRYSEDDVDFLEAVADRVAAALDTAITFEKQSERLAGVTLVAEAVQRAILAPPPPRAGPVTLSARYLSAATDAQVGGDLYEVFRGPSTVRLLVGDVRGKGLSAVRTATVVLGEFRAAAAGVGDVAHVAREIDRRIRPYLLDTEDFVTGVLVDIEHDGGFTVASCGHPAPILLGAGGDVESVVLDHSPPFGLGVDPVVARGRLTVGDRLLLFTDGMIEARAPGGGFVDPSVFLPQVARADFDSALDLLLTVLKREAGHAIDDDLALLLACYDPI